MLDIKYCSDVWCSLIEEKIDLGETVILEIATDSMMPLIRPTDKVTIKGCSAGDIRRGDIILFNRNNQLYIHRLLIKKQDVFITKGDKVLTLDQPVKLNHFMGRVIKIERHSKILDLEKQPWVIINKFLYYLSKLQVKSLSIARALKHYFT